VPPASTTRKGFRTNQKRRSARRHPAERGGLPPLFFCLPPRRSREPGGQKKLPPERSAPDADASVSEHSSETLSGRQANSTPIGRRGTLPHPRVQAGQQNCRKTRPVSHPQMYRTGARIFSIGDPVPGGRSLGGSACSIKPSITGPLPFPPAPTTIGAAAERTSTRWQIARQQAHEDVKKGCAPLGTFWVTQGGNPSQASQPTTERRASVAPPPTASPPTPHTLASAHAPRYTAGKPRGPVLITPYP